MPPSSTDQLGRPLRDLRISVTDRCNLRCPYCMPAEKFGEHFQFLPREELLNFQEIRRLAGIFAGLGARKIRITGGEPLLRSGLPGLIRDLAGIPGLSDLTLTTNGVLLAREAERLKAAGLKRLTVSLDSLDDAVFRELSGRDAGPDAVLEGIAAAERAGFRAIKINCVVKRGVNDGTILDLVRHFRGTGHIVRFIEFMDVGTLNGWNLSHVVSGREILDAINAEFPVVPLPAAYPGEVASRYRFLDGQGEIGLITSVSEPFCGGCTRARLSTKGELVTCLFASEGVDLREPLRSGASDSEIEEIIRNRWRLRTDRYSEERAANTPDSRKRMEMFRLGG